MSTITLAGVAAGVGAAASVGSVVVASKAAKSQAAAQQQALNQATTQINPFQVNGFGGMGAGYGMPAPGGQPAGGGGGIAYGNGGGGGFDMESIDPSNFPTSMGGVGGVGDYGNIFGSGGYMSGGYGFPGGWASYGQPQGVAGNSINLSAGDLEGVRSALSQFATNSVPGTGNQLPGNIQQALQGFMRTGSRLPGTNLGDINQLSAGAGDVYGQAQGDLRTAFGGFQPDLQSTAFRGAASQFQDASQGGQQVYDRTLGLLRQQAQPFETRAQDQLAQDQFGRGQLGTTGGGIQTEAFARGLGQADLQRQLQATQSGQQFQQNALGLGQGLFGAGQGLAGTGNTLLNDAFSRFGQTSGLISDLNNTQYNRMGAQNQLGYGRAQDLLQTQTGLAGLPASLQGGQLQNILAALQGQAGIQQQGLQLFGAGLSSEQAAANARIGAGSTLGNIVTNPNFGGAGYSTSAALGQLATSLSPSGGSLAALQGLFSGTPLQPFTSQNNFALSQPRVTPTGGP